MGLDQSELRLLFHEKLGNDAAIRIVEKGGLPEAIREAFTDPHFGRVVVAGGDGTVSLAAKWAFETNKAFGVVPLGTMNLFARTIGMPLDHFEALETLSRADIRHVDCGQANGETFVNHISIGFHPKLVRMRDAIPRGSRLRRMYNGLRVYLRLMHRHRKHRLTLHGEFEPFGAEAGLAVVAINRIQEGTAQIPHPEGQRRGRFGIYVSTHKSAWDLNKVIWRLMNGTLTESQHVEFRESAEVTVEADRNLHVSIDGEVFMTKPPIRCVMETRRLAVLVPPGTGDDHLDRRSGEVDGDLADPVEAR